MGSPGPKVSILVAAERTEPRTTLQSLMMLHVAARRSPSGPCAPRTLDCCLGLVLSACLAYGTPGGRASGPWHAGNNILHGGDDNSNCRMGKTPTYRYSIIHLTVGKPAYNYTCTYIRAHAHTYTYSHSHSHTPGSRACSHAHAHTHVHTSFARSPLHGFAGKRRTAQLESPGAKKDRSFETPSPLLGGHGLLAWGSVTGSASCFSCGHLRDQGRVGGSTSSTGLQTGRKSPCRQALFSRDSVRSVPKRPSPSPKLHRRECLPGGGGAPGDRLPFIVPPFPPPRPALEGRWEDLPAAWVGPALACLA